MTYQTIGIIGGVGPLATVDFEQKLLRHVDAKKDQDYPVIITMNNSKTPDRTAAIVSGGPSPVPEIRNSIHILKDAGAQVFCMPCHTGHTFYPEFQKDLENVTFVHLIETTADNIKNTYPTIKKVGLLCTDGTRQSRVYDQPLESRGLSVLYPSESMQKIVMEALYGTTGIKSGCIEEPREQLRTIADHLEQQGADIIIMGCTEIPLVLNTAHVPLVDATDVLAAEVLRVAQA